MKDDLNLVESDISDEQKEMIIEEIRACSLFDCSLYFDKNRFLHTKFKVRALYVNHLAHVSWIICPFDQEKMVLLTNPYIIISQELARKYFYQ